MCLGRHSSQEQNQDSDSELNKSKHTPCCLSGGGVEINLLLSSSLPKALKGQGPGGTLWKKQNGFKCWEKAVEGTHFSDSEMD